MVLDEFLVRLGLQDDLSSGLERVGGVIKGVGAAMGTLAVAAGVAAAKLSTEVVSQFGELEQNLGGSEAVFQEYAGHMQKIGEDAYKNMGVSQSQYLATANKMGALFQGSGLEVEKSAELTEKAMQRAADMASVMGIDMQFALESVAGAAKGNFTMMDNLGVSMNATTIEAYALAKGLDFAWNSASNAEKAEIAMQMFFEKTEQYAGNFARESTETISGAMGLLQAAAESLVSGLGNADADIANLTGNFIDAFQAVVHNVVPVLENMVEALPKVSDAILKAVEELLPVLLEKVTALFSQVLKTILTLLPKLIPAAADAIITIATALIDNLPLLINAAVQMVTALANGIGAALPQLVPVALNAVMTIITALLSKLPELFRTGVDMMGKLAEGLGNAIPLLKPITMAVSAIMSVLKALTPVVAAVTAGFIAYKASMMIAGIIQSVTAAIGVAQTVMALYAAGANMATISSMSLGFAAKAMGTIMAIATGQISLATVAQWLWNAALAANPIGLVIAGVSALVVGIIALIGWLNKQSVEEKRLAEQTKTLLEENDRLKESIIETGNAYAEHQEAIERDAKATSTLADKIAALSAVEDKSAEQKQELAAYVDMLNEAMGESVVCYDAETDSMSRNIEEIYALVEAQKAEAKAQAARERAVEIAKEQMAVEEQLNKIERQRIELDAALAAGTIKKRFYRDEVKRLSDTEAQLITQQDDLVISFDNATQAVTQAAAESAAANKIIAESASGMTDELVEANAIQKRLAQERIEAEQAVTDAMTKAASEQGLTLDEYKEKLEKSKEALKSYTDAATDMFNRLDSKSKFTVSQMTANMEHNQKVIEAWSDNISALAERGIDQGLLERLRDAGPESAGTVAALVKASEEELAKLSDVFANGSKVATDALMEQLGLPDTIGAGSDMVDNIAEGVEGNENLVTATTNLIEEAKAAAQETVNTSGFDSVGVDIVDGVYAGFQSREGWFRSQITAFFKGIVSDVKSELGIQSPSKVFAEIGGNMAQGVGVGFEDEMSGTGHKIKHSMDNAVDEASPSKSDSSAFDFAPAMAENIAEKLYAVIDNLPDFNNISHDSRGYITATSVSEPPSEPENEEKFIEKMYAITEKLGLSVSGGITEAIGSAVSQLIPSDGMATLDAPSMSGDMFAENFAAISTKMDTFMNDANRVMAQMGQSTNASYSTTSNSSITYDNRTYDNKSNFNINDTSGNPSVTAQMVDRNQSLRIRNLRGVFS